MSGGDQAALTELIDAIADGDASMAERLLAAAPELATAHVAYRGSGRAAGDRILEGIRHYVYGGDTALHVAAAGYRHEMARRLIALGSDVRAKNRRGAEPLHYAADGAPGWPWWDSRAQATTIALLIEAGADVHAVDMNGVMPLHRAVRTRSAAAVQALLEGGADPRRTNKGGSTPMDLATKTTGRGGSGSAAAKTEQGVIVALLDAALAHNAEGSSLRSE